MGRFKEIVVYFFLNDYRVKHSERNKDLLERSTRINHTYMQV